MKVENTAKITITLSKEEASLLAALVGSTSHADREEFFGCKFDAVWFGDLYDKLMLDGGCRLLDTYGRFRLTI